MATARIFATGRIIAGQPIEWHIAPLPALAEEREPAPDGTLQAMIDAARADVLAEEWQDYFLDQEWLDHWL